MQEDDHPKGGAPGGGRRGRGSKAAPAGGALGWRNLTRTSLWASHLALFAWLWPSALAAQTDFFNLDEDRPVAIEDAAPVERYAFEFQLAPVRVEGEPDGTTIWSVAPELAYGLLPRTDLSLHVPMALRRGDGPAGDASGVSGLEVSLFHNLNVETLSLPAFAFRGDLVLPVGGLADESTTGTVKAIATRTIVTALRLHANAAFTFGEEAAPGVEVEATRWRAGLALDRTFPLKSLLLVGNVYADRPLAEQADTRWIAGAGIRYQWSPRLALDAGVERRLGDEGPDWALTFGSAYAFALPSLIPNGGPRTP